MTNDGFFFTTPATLRARSNLGLFLGRAPLADRTCCFDRFALPALTLDRRLLLLALGSCSSALALLGAKESHHLRACRIGVLLVANHTLRDAVRVLAVLKRARKAEVIAAELLRFAPRATSAAPLVWQLGQGIAVNLAMLFQLFCVPSVPNGTKRRLEIGMILELVISCSTVVNLGRLGCCDLG
jgi:hypothetical protein